MPGSFPPLAKSDFLSGQLPKSILGLVQGLAEPITVNGKRFNGAMPPAVLNDEQVADVLNFAGHSWGNSNRTVTAAEVGEVRARSKFPTFEALVAANTFAPIPPAPAGFKVRELVRLPAHGTRLAGKPGENHFYVLGGDGDVWRVEGTNGALRQILWGKNYLRKDRGNPSTVGMTFDRKGRFYVVANHRKETGVLVTNFVAIYRSTKLEEGEPAELEPWVVADYPWGIGPFNHGVGHIAQGPDGFMYVGSGSRTDGNEPGTDSRFSKLGEHPLTACIWKIDPEAEQPKIEVFARGHRNPFGFCWNFRGEMVATDNGPDADAPEELNVVEVGKHYGFPYQFSDWSDKPYSYTPDPPADLKFVFPVRNLGPAGGFAGRPLSTFDPHSSPAGIVYLNEKFPAEYRDSYLVVRFGNLLKKPKDVGFDLLQVRWWRDPAGGLSAQINSLMERLARPIDIYLGPDRTIYLLEYTRTTTFGGSLGFPGRILELAPSEKGTP